jgi:hypothetical protein
VTPLVFLGAAVLAVPLFRLFKLLFAVYRSPMWRRHSVGCGSSGGSLLPRLCRRSQKRFPGFFIQSMAALASREACNPCCFIGRRRSLPTTLRQFAENLATAKGSVTLKIMRNRKPIHHTALAANDEQAQPALPRADVFTRRAAVTAISLLFVGWEMPGRASPPSPTKKVEVMSDPRVKTYEIYLSAWSAIPDDERAKRLRESLSNDVVFTNPVQTRHGL